LSLVKEIMNMKKLNVTLAILVAAVMAGNAQTTVTSQIVGYQNIPIKGSNGGAAAFTFVPAQLAKSPAFTGLGSASGAVVTLSGGAVGDVTTLPHYLVIKSGSGLGYISDVVSSTSTTVTTAQDLSAYITSGTTVALIPHVLLSDLLGTGTSLVIQGGSSDASADLVYVVNADGTSLVPYYYKNAGIGTKGWKNASTGAVESVVRVYPSESMIIQRIAPPDTAAITQVGNVADQSMKLVYDTGFTCGASAFPSALTLNSLSTVLQGAATVDSADVVYIVNATKDGLTPYYYKNAGIGTKGWKDSSTGALADANMDIGGGFIIERKQATPALLTQAQP